MQAEAGALQQREQGPSGNVVDMRTGVTGGACSGQSPGSGEPRCPLVWPSLASPGWGGIGAERSSGRSFDPPQRRAHGAALQPEAGGTPSAVALGLSQSVVRNRVESSQFDAGVGGGEPPVGAAAAIVSALNPGLHFVVHGGR